VLLSLIVLAVNSLVLDYLGAKAPGRSSLADTIYADLICIEQVQPYCSHSSSHLN
jgi:hypothetical protein